MCRIAAGSRIPTPRDEVVLRHMLLQQREIAPAIAGWILQLPAYVSNGLAFPCHLDRRQLPAGMPRNAPIGRSLQQIEIAIGVAGYAMIASDPRPVVTALGGRLV